MFKYSFQIIIIAHLHLLQVFRTKVFYQCLNIYKMYYIIVWKYRVCLSLLYSIMKFDNQLHYSAYFCTTVCDEHLSFSNKLSNTYVIIITTQHVEIFCR